MSRTLVAICLVLAMVSVSYASVGSICPWTGKVVQEVIGNWENGDMEGWSADTTGTAYLEITNGIGNTSGDNSLLVAYNGGYWQLVYTFPVPLTNFAGATLCFDLTMTGGAVGWDDFDEKLSFNSDGTSGYQEYAPRVVNRADGSSTGHDWGEWVPSFERTYMTDISAYNATGATWMVIRISGQGWPQNGVYLDNVEICCPEPATMALLGLGGLALIRRKK